MQTELGLDSRLNRPYLINGAYYFTEHRGTRSFCFEDALYLYSSGKSGAADQDMYFKLVKRAYNAAEIWQIGFTLPRFGIDIKERAPYLAITAATPDELELVIIDVAGMRKYQVKVELPLSDR